MTQATLVAYFGELAEHDARDVAGAAKWIMHNGGAFPPSLPELIAQVEREREVRVTYERLPDFTGSDALPPGELEKRLEAGARASAGASMLGDAPGIRELVEREIREGLEANPIGTSAVRREAGVRQGADSDGSQESDS